MKEKARYIYSSGRLCHADQYNTSTMVHALNYGTGAFEGMRVIYDNKSNHWFVFRPDLHFQRLLRSAQAIDIDLDITFEDFIYVLSRLIIKNNLKENLYIRPLVYKNSTKIGLMKPSDYDISVFLEPMPLRSPRKYSGCVVSQKRPADGTYNVKLSGNYLLSYFAQKEATERGADIGIMLSADGYVSEASLMNVFFISNDIVFTPSIACGALDGITRKCLIEIIVKYLGIQCKTGKYRLKRLLDADEIFLTGTGSGINTIDSIMEKHLIKFKNKTTGLIWNTYRDVITGRNDEFRNWLYVI